MINETDGCCFPNNTPDFRKAVMFIGLTFFISYSMIGLYLLLGGKWIFPWSLILGVIYMFIPAISAFIVQKGFYKEQVIGPLKVSFKPNIWFLFALILPPVIAAATMGVSLLFPSIRYDPQMTAFWDIIARQTTPEQFAHMRVQAEALPVHPFWLGLVSGLIAGPTVNAIAGFGEELGWRGLLLHTLRPIGFWKVSAVIGVIWGLWHAPIILQGHNYPHHPVIGVFMMTGWTILLTPIFVLVTVKAKSMIAASIMHGTLNGTVGLAVMLVAGGSDLIAGVTGVSGFIVLAILNLGILLYDRRYKLQLGG